MKTLKRFEAHNKSILIDGLSGGAVVIAGTPSRIVMRNCGDIRVEPENSNSVTVSGDGGGKQFPLVAVLGSAGVSFAPLELLGATDETSKQTWEASVPNGFEARPDCDYIHVDSVSGQCLHYAVLGRCSKFSMHGGSVRYVSGDFVRINGDGFQLKDFTGICSLDVFGYKRVHRDCGQFYQEDKTKLYEGVPVLSDGLIKGCRFWTPDGGHQWAKSADGLMFTDGVYRNIHIEGNQVHTNNTNGIRADVMIDCEVTPDNVFKSADEVPSWVRQ